MTEGGDYDVIKRNGRRPTESFDPKKLHASIQAACHSAGTAPGHAEQIARAVVKEVHQWLETHPEVTSHDLRRTAARTLKNHSPDAAYLYEQHRITL
ncbi:MAG: ATP cone domain-containing protein [Candidatus Saccharimonadales bacterium]